MSNSKATQEQQECPICDLCGNKVDTGFNQSNTDQPRHDGCVEHAIKVYKESQEYKSNEEKGKEIIKTLSKMMNGCGNKDKVAEAMARQFRCEHNTLEQLMIGLFQKMIVAIAEDEHLPVDARNEASIAWCKKVAEIEARFPFI